MGSIRKILVPTDFSRHALEAFRQALTVARATGASVTVLHVAPPPATVVDGGRLTTNAVDAGPVDLWENFRDLMAEGLGVAVEHEVIVADKPDVSHILNIVEAAGCDLIVMGTRGLNGLRHRLFGSLTGEVVRLARCPVMVVKGSAAEDSPPVRNDRATEKPGDGAFPQPWGAGPATLEGNHR